MTLPRTEHRYEALDGLRGVAALAVMVHHLGMFSGLVYPHNAWTAVDLFFMLSGFVLMHSYAPRIRAGMAFGTFFTARAVRLLPMYLMGLSVGVVAAGLGAAACHDSLADLGLVTGLSAFMLPYFGHLAWPMNGMCHADALFPLNTPAWSLFFEMAVNLGFFFVLTRWRRASGWLVLISLGIFLGLILREHVVNPGWGRGDFLEGIPRVISEFGIGALLYRWHHLIRLRAKILPWLLIAAVCVLFYSANVARAWTDVFLLMPVTLLLTASLSLGGWQRRVAHWLGELSYPLYMLHVPINNLAIQLLHTHHLAARLQLFLVCSLSVLAATLVMPIDRRVRAWLTTHLRPTPAGATAHA
jgi:peptidoglycan/LPS O-acetylase OafA/YrhL